MKNGHGHYKWPDGSEYIGGWKNNLIDGEGTFKWGDGRRYKGKWKKSLMHG
jgi:hypothetical protein